MFLIIDIAINRSKGVKREGGRKDDNILLETVNKFKNYNAIYWLKFRLQ